MAKRLHFAPTMTLSFGGVDLGPVDVVSLDMAEPVDARELRLPPNAARTRFTSLFETTDTGNYKAFCDRLAAAMPTSLDMRVDVAGVSVVRRVRFDEDSFEKFDDRVQVTGRLVSGPRMSDGRWSPLESVS